MAERALFAHGYVSVGAETVEAARRAIDRVQFDVVLCDIVLGADSGLELARDICHEAPGTAVVMLTGLSDRETAAKAIALGANAYVVKPFTEHDLIIQIDGAIARNARDRARRDHVVGLEHVLAERTATLRVALQHLDEARSEASSAGHALADRLNEVVSLRDVETGSHVERVGRLAVVVARTAEIDEWSMDDLQIAAMLHDVGKIGVPDRVLLKAGALDEDEREAVELHAEMGHQLLTDIPSGAMRLAASIAYSHHERWDGSGYPRRLAGLEIPLEGRITAVVDVFDALTSDRPYRPAYSIDTALDLMRKERGRHFDPALFDAFITGLNDVLFVKAQLRDDGP